MNEQEAHRDFMITTVSLNKSNEDIEKLKHYVIGEVGDTLILGYKEHIEDKDACLIGEIDKEDFSTLLCSYLDLVCKDNFDEKCPRNSDQEKMFSKYRREGDDIYYTFDTMQGPIEKKIGTLDDRDKQILNGEIEAISL